MGRAARGRGRRDGADLTEYPKPAPGTGALYGHQWEPRQLAAWNYAAGFTDALELCTMTAIDLSESQGFDHAIHVNYDLSEDRGVKQLNSIHKAYTDEIAYDPRRAALAARSLVENRQRNGQIGFEDWAAFTTGIYLRDSYLGKAVRGVGNFLADELLKLPVKLRLDGTAYEHRFTTPILSYQHNVAGSLHWFQVAKKDLGFGFKSRATVQKVQEDLSKGIAAAKTPLPG